MLEITKINVYPVNSETAISIANGNVVFNNVLSIRFSILKNKDGKLFCSWPSVKGADNKYYPQVSIFPDGENDYTTKNNIENEIIKEYNKIIGISPIKKEESKEEKQKEEKPVFTWKKD